MSEVRPPYFPRHHSRKSFRLDSSISLIFPNDRRCLVPATKNGDSSRKTHDPASSEAERRHHCQNISLVTLDIGKTEAVQSLSSNSRLDDKANERGDFPTYIQDLGQNALRLP
jgi:hypothetical protein